MVTTGSVSPALGERTRIVSPVSTVSRNAICTPPNWSRTTTPTSGSLNPSGPRCTRETDAATVSAGVPAFADHPGCSGPPTAQTEPNTTKAATATTTNPRTGRVTARPSRTLSAMATTTAETHAETTATIQYARESLPGPSPCTAASGHDA